MNTIDLAKEDMAFDYGERSFRLRAYRDEGSWHSIIIENKTPLRNSLPPTADAAKCFAQAMAFVTAAVDGANSVGLQDASVPELETRHVMVGVPMPMLDAANARGGA